MKRTTLTVSILFALGPLIGSPNVLATDLVAPSSPAIIRCDQPFMFGFGSWEKAKSDFPIRPDGIHISAVDSQGGAGVADLKLNLADYGDWTPALTLAVGERNQAAVLNLQLQDADGTGQTYGFNLPALKPGAAQRITAEFGVSLAEPQHIEKPGTLPGLGLVVNCMIIGDWSGHAVEVVLSRVELVPPTEDLRSERTKLKELQAKEAEQARQEAATRE
jgi:hypothetical protein